MISTDHRPCRPDGADERRAPGHSRARGRRQEAAPPLPAEDTHPGRQFNLIGISYLGDFSTIWQFFRKF